MGVIRKESRIDHRDTTAFARNFESLAEPAEVVMDAYRNWVWLYDLLGTMPGVCNELLTHPEKTKIIAGPFCISPPVRRMLAWSRA